VRWTVPNKTSDDGSVVYATSWDKRILSAVMLTLVAGLIAWWLLSSPQRSPERFTGYVVADNLYLASPIAGTVDQLFVMRGQRIASGAPLFRMDVTSLAARADQARAQIGEAVAGLQERRAALAKARAEFASGQTEVERSAIDLAHYRGAASGMKGAVSVQQLDQARFAAASAAHQRDAARGEVRASEAQVQSAQAQVARANAGLADAERQVAQLSPTAPVAGRIEDTLFQRGEWAPANAPVISLIPDGQVKVRFYVSQALLARFRPGTLIAIACDGCAPGMTATVNRVATRPEFTPPVIYSLKERDKLVFMIEAVPARPELLTPGQPIDVSRLSEKRP
jgi:HlyD family secretion protein